MKINTKSSGYGTIVLTLINLFAQIMQFVFRIALTRLIGAEGMGLYQLVLPAHTVLMSLAVSGFTVATARLTAQYNATGSTRAIRQLVRQAQWLYIAVFAACAVLILPLSDMISVHLLGDARTRMGILLLLPVVLLTGWENVQKNFFYGMKRVNPPVVTEIVEQIVRVSSVLLLILFLKPAYEELQVAFIVVGMLISEVFSASLLTVFYLKWKHDTPETGAELPQRTMLKEISGIAVPIALSNLAANMLGSANMVIIPGRLIASGLSSGEAMSSYGITFGMTLPLLGIPTVLMYAMAFIMMPRIAENVTLGRWNEVKRAVYRTILISVVFLMPACTLVCVFGPDIASALFKQKNAGLYITPMMIATAFTCMKIILGSMLNGMGAQRRSASNLVFSGVVELAITWFACAMPDIRLLGFVLAFMVSSTLGMVLNAWDVHVILRREVSQ